LDNRESGCSAHPTDELVPHAALLYNKEYDSLPMKWEKPIKLIVTSMGRVRRVLAGGELNKALLEQGVQSNTHPQ